MRSRTRLMIDGLTSSELLCIAGLILLLHLEIEQKKQLFGKSLEIQVENAQNELYLNIQIEVPLKNVGTYLQSNPIKNFIHCTINFISKQNTLHIIRSHFMARLPPTFNIIKFVCNKHSEPSETPIWNANVVQINFAYSVKLIFSSILKLFLAPWVYFLIFFVQPAFRSTV